MKASDLWSGTEYAWHRDRPRGIETPPGAVRVRLISIVRRKAYYGSERLSTFAEVECVEDMKSHPYKKAGQIFEVRARDIVDFWDDYSERRTAIDNRRNAAEAERQRLRQKRKDENEAIEKGFYEKGIRITIANEVIFIQRKDAIAWLGLVFDDGVPEQETRSETHGVY